MQKHVLIVDDEEPLRDIIRAVLNRLDVVSLPAKDGKSAIEIARSQTTIDLVIIDMNMPEMTGEETYSEFRKIHPDAGVIFVSGYDMRDVLVKLDLKCPNCFLKKPFSISELSKIVTKMLES